MASNYYEELGVTPWASEVQIRQAYRELSKLYHPDITQLPPAIASAKFCVINTAYAVLSNPERRSQYDRQILFSRHDTLHTPNNFSRPDNDGLPIERPLSGGELFALLLIGATLVGCLAIAGTIAYLRG